MWFCIALSFAGVGADAHIGPAECTVYTEICGKFAAAQWADVGIGPYNEI